MKLVAILVFCTGIYLAVSVEFNHFIELTLSRSQITDVAFVGIDRYILDAILRSQGKLVLVWLINARQATTKRSCSLFLIQLPKSKTEVGAIGTFIVRLTAFV